MLKFAIAIDRVQKIKVAEEDNFFFSKIILVKQKMFSNKLAPFDLDSGKKIIELQLFEEADKEYHTVNIDSFKKIKGGFTVEYLD